MAYLLGMATKVETRPRPPAPRRPGLRPRQAPRHDRVGDRRSTTAKLWADLVARIKARRPIDRGPRSGRCPGTPGAEVKISPDGPGNPRPIEEPGTRIANSRSQPLDAPRPACFPGRLALPAQTHDREHAMAQPEFDTVDRGRRPGKPAGRHPPLRLGDPGGGPGGPLRFCTCPEGDRRRRRRDAARPAAQPDHPGAQGAGDAADRPGDPLGDRDQRHPRPPGGPDDVLLLRQHRDRHHDRPGPLEPRPARRRGPDPAVEGPGGRRGAGRARGEGRADGRDQADLRAGPREHRRLVRPEPPGAARGRHARPGDRPGPDPRRAARPRGDVGPGCHRLRDGRIRAPDAGPPLGRGAGPAGGLRRGRGQHPAERAGDLPVARLVHRRRAGRAGAFRSPGT